MVESTAVGLECTVVTLSVMPQSYPPLQAPQAPALRTWTQHGRAPRIPGHGAARGRPSRPVLLPGGGRGTQPAGLRILDEESSSTSPSPAPAAPGWKPPWRTSSSPARSSRCSPTVSSATGSAIWPAATAATSSACAKPWGEPFDPQEAREFIRRERPRVVAFVQAETSTGLYNQAKPICEAAHEVDALTIADCVTSLGGMPVTGGRERHRHRLQLLAEGTRLPSGLCRRSPCRRAPWTA